MPKIIEIKARCADQSTIRTLLQTNNADFKGMDHQIDNYFNVPEGRLKLREGEIENNLIHYHRENQSGPKLSTVSLYKSKPASTLKEVLTNALGILVVVDKIREIYFIDNVKFHIDAVKELGTFVEIEAIDEDDSHSLEELLQQCQYYLNLFQIPEKDLISHSYSDLLLNPTP